MPTRPAIFLDDGDVMNDNTRRGEQWQRHVADYLSPRLGGDHTAWKEADIVVAQSLWDRFGFAYPGGAYADTRDSYLADWLTGMCRRVGVDAPESPAAVAMARETHAYVTRRVRASFPGVIETIRQLSADGYGLFTASGEHSEELDGYLEGMSVRELFGRLFGPDLVGTPKEGPLYYRRVFADAGVVPGDALVVDDSLDAVAWPVEAGATAVLVTGRANDADGASAVIDRLAELPRAIEHLDFS
jgi:HAD superfamily hydrolase (TIGR01509 family)